MNRRLRAVSTRCLGARVLLVSSLYPGTVTPYHHNRRLYRPHKRRKP